MQSPRESIESFYGDQTRVSPWLVVDQAMINKFGEATGDMDWMHTDPERASRESPFGGTVAFGFWTISLLTYFGRQTLQRDYPGDALYGLNYGFDRLRLIAPVRVGKRIRCHIRLIDITDKGSGRYLVKSAYQVEVEDEPKPAMIAEWLFMLVFPTP
jgi:acyl dehydratase